MGSTNILVLKDVDRGNKFPTSRAEPVLARKSKLDLKYVQLDLLPV